jgi:hypothetical protein
MALKPRKVSAQVRAARVLALNEGGGGGGEAAVVAAAAGISASGRSRRAGGNGAAYGEGAKEISTANSAEAKAGKSSASLVPRVEIDINALGPSVQAGRKSVSRAGVAKKDAISPPRPSSAAACTSAAGRAKPKAPIQSQRLQQQHGASMRNTATGREVVKRRMPLASFLRAHRQLDDSMQHMATPSQTPVDELGEHDR